MKAEIFRGELEEMLKVAKEIGLKYIDITSGDLHRKIGGYPGKNHNMPSCCNVMKSLMKNKRKGTGFHPTFVETCERIKKNPKGEILRGSFFIAQNKSLVASS